jgi:hypothetical protein
VKILGKRTRSIPAIFGKILPPLTILFGLFLIAAELAVSATPPTVQNPSIALEGFTGPLDLDRLSSSPRPSILVLIGALVSIGVTPWGRILQEVRRKNSCKTIDRLAASIDGPITSISRLHQGR